MYQEESHHHTHPILLPFSAFFVPHTVSYCLCKSSVWVGWEGRGGRRPSILRTNPTCNIFISCTNSTEHPPCFTFRNARCVCVYNPSLFNKSRKWSKFRGSVAIVGLHTQFFLCQFIHPSTLLPLPPPITTTTNSQLYYWYVNRRTLQCPFRDPVHVSRHS